MSLVKARAVPFLLCALLLSPDAARPAPQEVGPPESGPPESAPLVETQRVTAFDLLVELNRPKKPLRSVEAPADLELDDFTVLWDGTPLPLVDLASGTEDSEPWRLVVYIDRVLSSNHTIRWAAMELAERVERLTALGEVEIVVADPEPRRALAPTRDSELIDGTLSGVFLAPAGIAEIVSRREEFLIDQAGDTPHSGEEQGASAAAAALRAGRDERRLVRRQTDRLLGWLVDSEPPTSRRAVLLVGDGWDLRPELFYDRSGTAPAPQEAPSPLGRQTRELAETLAAYGWIAVPLAPAAPPAGFGRFGIFVLPDVTFPWLFAYKLRSLEVWLDGNRKPKKADALTELGNSLRAQGRLEEAVETYKKAVYHYYDHPKTATRQAKALVALGETLELQAKTSEARDAFRVATVFDPLLEKRFPFAAASLLSAHEPLEQLAEITAGRLVSDPDSLDLLLSSLARRVRLTAQLPGTPDGALHPVEVRLDRPGFEHRSPPVARWGTPATITELRLRSLLDGELTAGKLELAASLADDPRADDGTVLVDLLLATGGGAPANSGEPAGLLVSWASAGPEMPTRHQTRSRTISTEVGTPLSIDPSPGHLWLALVVEDPASGLWGGTSLDLPDG